MELGYESAHFHIDHMISVPEYTTLVFHVFQIINERNYVLT